jgi:hypothetical protein
VAVLDRVKQRQYFLTPLVLPVLLRTAVPTIAAGMGVDTHHACGFHSKLLQEVQVISVCSLLR